MATTFHICAFERGQAHPRRSQVLAGVGQVGSKGYPSSLSSSQGGGGGPALSGRSSWLSITSGRSATCSATRAEVSTLRRAPRGPLGWRTGKERAARPVGSRQHGPEASWFQALGTRGRRLPSPARQEHRGVWRWAWSLPDPERARAGVGADGPYTEHAPKQSWLLSVQGPSDAAAPGDHHSLRRTPWLQPAGQRDDTLSPACALAWRRAPWWVPRPQAFVTSAPRPRPHGSSGPAGAVTSSGE